MTRVQRFLLMIAMISGRPLWSQSGNVTPSENTTSENIYADANSDPRDDHMELPPPVSGGFYSTATMSEDRSNYIRGGMSFTSAYTDNARGNVGGSPVSDVSYSFAPSLALDEKTARVRATLSYAPGFTFYQRNSGLNEADHNAAIDFQYRVTQHLTFTARDSFQKTSSVFNTPDPAVVQGVSSGPTDANFSIISPIADRLSNVGNVGLNYQFSMNGMVGVSGSFSNLHFANPSQLPGLFDSSTRGFSLFHSLRISRMHYIGASYAYQTLLAYPVNGTSETQTQTLSFFYTLYLREKFSVSFFGGPQHSTTAEPPVAPNTTPFTAIRMWTPAGGASLNWQGRLTSVAFGYSHVISSSSGLSGAVKMSAVSFSARRQMSKSMTGSIGAAYTQNDVLQSPFSPASNGHSISGSASLQRRFRQFNVELAYTRLHQDYSNVAVISATPDTNRESIGVSYQFSRPLGR